MEVSGSGEVDDVYFEHEGLVRIVGTWVHRRCHNAKPLLVGVDFAVPGWGMDDCGSRSGGVAFFDEEVFDGGVGDALTSLVAAVLDLAVASGIILTHHPNIKCCVDR